MSKNAIDPGLTQLANVLKTIEASPEDFSPTIGLELRYCHLLPGNLWRVSKYIKGKIVPFGFTKEPTIAAMYADCMTERLWDYQHETPFEYIQCRPSTSFNFNEYEFSQMVNLHPQVVDLANSVTQYLIRNDYIPELSKLRKAREINRQVVADIQARIQKVEDEKRIAEKSLANLYKL